ncbi:hypothetical protein ACFRK5_36175 [Streptomyces niveus]|uniref:hypothetical protein n=1 Tax=Streptomyces niveus TaxID=193462 RepID=UPI0036C5B914
MDGQRRAAYEQTFQELLAVVARLDGLRRQGQGGLEPMANAAMYATSYAAWTLWHSLRPGGVVAPIFGDKGDKYLELAREWADVGCRDAAQAEAKAVKTLTPAWDSMIDP